MGWYLSQQNERLLPPILKRLINSKGRVELPSSDPETLINLIRNAGHTKYPELLKWRYKKKENSVICIPKDPTGEVDVVLKVDEYLDYIGIITYLSGYESSMDLLFVNILLSDNEFNNLIDYCKESNLTVSKDDQGVRVIRNVSINPKGEEASRDMD